MENQRLETAITAHRSGDLETAERLYRAILAVSPDHSDANHNLGVLLVSTQDLNLLYRSSELPLRLWFRTPVLGKLSRSVASTEQDRR